jgi:hypothetical protein
LDFRNIQKENHNMNEIAKAWRGEERLWKVFWIYNFLIGIAMGMPIEYIENLIALSIFFIAVFLPWGVWVTVSMWRCAFNSGWRGWGYIVRGIVILALVAIVLMIVAAILVPFESGTTE